MSASSTRIARHYRTGALLTLTWREGRLSSLAPIRDAPAVASGEEWVAPGLFDLQINGCHGRNFTSERLAPEGVRHVVSVLREHGVSGFCPTLITGSFETIRHGVRTLVDACTQDAQVNRAVGGIHLEGPWISPEDGPRGAHPREHVRPPDWNEFQRWQEAAQGRIRLVTLAPEHEGALAIIEKLTAAGVVVALGHTAASASRLREASRAGARLSTHLGNGSHAVLPRHENYLWEQAAADELLASLITDGHHLPPAVIRCLVRAKTPARVILTCDASSLAGLPPGRYREWGQDLEVRPEGKVVVPGTAYLAGAAVFTDTCVALVQRYAGVSLAEAIEMASSRPRELLGLPVGTLEAGQPADLVFFRHEPGQEFAVSQTLVAGEPASPAA